MALLACYTNMHGGQNRYYKYVMCVCVCVCNIVSTTLVYMCIQHINCLSVLGQTDDIYIQIYNRTHKGTRTYTVEMHTFHVKHMYRLI